MDDLQQQGDAQASESRAQAFSGGMSGGGGSAYIASALPRVQQAPRAFNPSASVLMAANSYSGVGNGTSGGTLRISNPFGAAMMSTLKQSGSGKAQE